MPASTPKIAESALARAASLRGPHSRFEPNDPVGQDSTVFPTGGASRSSLRHPIRVLLVDDQRQEIDRWLTMLAEKFGGDVRPYVAHTAAGALEILGTQSADVVLTEYRLPDGDGLDLIATIAKRYPEVATIVITSHGNEMIAANALKFGARDYLVNSATDAAALERSILQATSKTALDRQQSQRLEQLEQSRHEMDQIVRSLSHDMSAMFMLLDHSFQQLKDVADPLAAKVATADQRATLPPADAAGRQLVKPSGHGAAEQGAVAAASDDTDPASVGLLTERFAHVEACLRESKRFLDDLTTVARTGTVHMEPSRVELSSVVEEVLFEQRELLAERKIKVEVAGELPAVWCNPLRVKQVLTNLVRNAARHGCDPHDPRITIGRRPPRNKAETAFEWIMVHDNGRGIPAGAMEEIFEPGRRLADAHPDGSGMGLSIVRKIVQHYGGHVFVEPNCGGGTTFVLSLPKVIPAP